MGVGIKAFCLWCGDVIQSKHVHDYVACKCGAIFIDGGSDYTRCGGDFNAFTVLPEEYKDKKYISKSIRRRLVSLKNLSMDKVK